jgi:hypothetical protein
LSFKPVFWVTSFSPRHSLRSSRNAGQLMCSQRRSARLRSPTTRTYARSFVTTSAERTARRRDYGIRSRSCARAGLMTRRIWHKDPFAAECWRCSPAPGNESGSPAPPGEFSTLDNSPIVPIVTTPNDCGRWRCPTALIRLLAIRFGRAFIRRTMIGTPSICCCDRPAAPRSRLLRSLRAVRGERNAGRTTSSWRSDWPMISELQSSARRRIPRWPNRLRRQCRPAA